MGSVRRCCALVIAYGVLGSAVMLISTPIPAMAGPARAEMVKSVGDSAPSFSVATDKGTVANYFRDYYGQHHLVMTFFPAAFTPV